MAVTTEQKVDFLLKKVGYSLSKTGSVTGTGAISGGTTKEPFAETLASPITVQSTSIWADSTYIPTTPPGSDTGYVKGYRAAASGHRMTADSTVAGSRAFIAYTTYNNTSTAILGDWINTQFGADYIVKVYKGDPNSGGVQLSASGSGSDDTWFFDYTSGILNFNGAALPSGVTDTNVYIVGYRYLGTKGVQPPGGIGTFHNLYVSGITTLVGNVFAESSVQIGIGLSVAGISTFTGNIDANNGIDVTGLSTFRSGLNVIGLLQTNDDVNFTGAAANVTWDKSDNRLEFEDDASISIGDDDDLELSHDGTTSLIRDKRGSGSVLKIGADKLWLQNKDGNEAYLEATDNGSVKLYYDFGSRIETTGYGASITGGTSGIGTLSGPAAFHIDPAAVGDNTGLVVIKGNLQVDGTQTTVNSTTMTVDDKNIVLGQGSANDAAIDGGGITLESSGGGNKLLTWIDSTDSWTSSEHFDLAAGKSYDIAGTEIIHSLRATLGGTLSVAGISTFSANVHLLDNDRLRIGGSTGTFDGLDLYHDSSDSYIADSGTGILKVSGSGIEILTGTAPLKLGSILAQETQIYFSNAEKLASKVWGIDVTGTLNTDQLGVSGISTFTGNIDANGNLDVDGYTELDDLNVSGITTTVNFNVGTSGQTLVGINTILDEDDMASNSATALATQQSIKAYVDAGDTAQDLDFTGDTGSGAIDLDSETFQVTGTPFEIVTTGSGQVLNVSLPDTVIIGAGLTVTSKLTVGANATNDVVGITTILDQDDMASDSATALATQQSIKKYVDDRSPGGPGGAALAVSADSGSNESINLNTEVLDIEGTANEIETVTGTNKVVIGLPDDVTIADDLTVTGDIASVTNLNVTGISTFTGSIDANGALDVDGTSDLDQVNIAAGLNVTAGISTFAELINATKSIQGNENLVVTGISTLTSNTYIGTAGTVFTALVGAAASVGIGSALPDYMLDVAGAINSETDVKIQGVSVTDQALNDAVAMAIALG